MDLYKILQEGSFHKVKVGIDFGGYVTDGEGIRGKTSIFLIFGQ